MQLVEAIEQVEPKPRPWTSDEFYQMVELGFFREQRVELIEGEIVLMPAQRNYHAASVELTAEALRKVFGPGYWVRVQATLDLTPFSVPDPDVAVVPGSPHSCAADNPTTALLLVEVSDSSLRFDRHDKASLYARAGIADYWIVNLVHRCLEIRRTPAADVKQRYGSGYADMISLVTTEYATPLAMPQARILVADLLP